MAPISIFARGTLNVFARAVLAALALFLGLASLFAHGSGRGATPVQAATAPADQAAVVLRESIEAPKTVSYVGELQTIRFSTNRANATIMRVEHRAPSLTRRWYLAPDSLYGDYIITRGIATYQFDTKHDRVTVTHNPALQDDVSANGNLERAMLNYRVIFDGRETIAARPTLSLSLINKYTGERAVRLWIDEETHLVLKREEYHGNGAVASQERFEELRYTSQIPDDIFATDPPPGYDEVTGTEIAAPSSDVERVERDAGFAPQCPKDLPQGFVLSTGDVTTVNGVRTLHLLYSDGLRTISLFENATGAAADFGLLRPHTIHFQGQEAEYVEDGPTTLLTWRERGLYFALVSDLMRPELIAIASSVVP
jgi:outer membrane lipoprotein-sorting protein